MLGVQKVSWFYYANYAVCAQNIMARHPHTKYGTHSCMLQTAHTLQKRGKTTQAVKKLLPTFIREKENYALIASYTYY